MLNPTQLYHLAQIIHQERLREADQNRLAHLAAPQRRRLAPAPLLKLVALLLALLALG